MWLHISKLEHFIFEHFWALYTIVSYSHNYCFNSGIIPIFYYIDQNHILVIYCLIIVTLYFINILSVCLLSDTLIVGIEKWLLVSSYTLRQDILFSVSIPGNLKSFSALTKNFTNGEFIWHIEAEKKTIKATLKTLVGWNQYSYWHLSIQVFFNMIFKLCLSSSCPTAQ